MGYRFTLALLLGGLVTAIGVHSAPAVGQQAETSAKSSDEALRAYEGARNAQINNAFDVAVEEWSKFLTDFPKDPLVPRVLYNLGRCHVELRNWDQAIAALDRLVREFPKAEDLENAYLSLGWAQYSAAQAGKTDLYPVAATSFSTLLEKFPAGAKRDEAYFFLGEANYLQGKRPEAVVAYQQVVNNFAESRLRDEALYALGVAQEELQQYAEAGATYEQFLDDFPEHKLATEVKMRKAETLLQTGSAEDAAAIFGEVAATPDFPTADHARLRQAFCLSSLDRPKEAADLYVKLIQDFPQSAYVADAELAAARDYYRAKAFEDAAKWFANVHQRGGEQAVEAAHWLCRIYLMRKQPEQAEQLAAATVPGASSSQYLVDLLLDQADAIYDQPAKDKQQALNLYLQIAKEHADHRLAPQALYNAAFTAFELKQFPESLKLAQQFSSAFPMDALAADAQFLAAECLIQSRDYAAAQAELKKLVSDHGQRPEIDAWRLRLALVTYLRGDHAGAIEFVQPLLKQLKQPEQLAEAHFIVGVCQFLQNDYSAAAGQFESSLQASRDWRQAGETVVYLARCRQKQGQLDEAIALVSGLLQDSPQDLIVDQATYRLGEFNYAAGNFEAARAAYAKLLDNFPQSTFVPFAYYGKGWCEIKGQDYPAAVTTFTGLLQNHANHDLADDARLALAMAKRQAGNQEEAIAEFDQFLASNPPQPQRSDALYERALAEAALKQYDKAIATLGGLLEANPQYASADKALYELAWAYRGANQNDQAVAQFARLANEYSQSPLAAEANFHLGEDLYQQQKYEEAIAAYTKAKDHSQDKELKEKSLYKLGWSQFQQQQYEPAFKSFEEQAAAFPAGTLSGDAVFMQAECLFKLKRYEPALKLFESISAADEKRKPSSDQMIMLTLLHGGQAASQQEQWDTSLQLLNTLIEKYPESAYLAEARYERGWAYQKQGKLDKAWDDFEKAADERNALGARARFMMGEVRFAQKKYEDAIKEFQRGMFLYGGDEAPADIKVWQAKSAFEAGRCAELLVQSASSPQVRSKAIEEAKKFYNFVTQKHPKNELAAEAQKRLEALAKL